MKLKSLLTTLIIFFITSTLFAAEPNKVESKKYRTGDVLNYPLRSKLYDYTPSLGKNNIVYYILNVNQNEYDIKIDDFTFRVKKGDTFQTHHETKGNGDNFQSYIIRDIISEEITDISNNYIEITYKVTKTEKYLKKGLKGDYEKVDKFPWE